MIKRFTLFLVASAVVMVCRDAVAQIVYSVNIVGLYQFPFPPGTALVGQTETNGMTWAGAGPAGPPISVASNSLAVAGLASPAGHQARLAGVNGPAARIALSSNLNSGTVFCSLALRVADLGTLDANGGTLAGFNNVIGASTSLPAPLVARLLIRSHPNGYQLGLSANSPSVNEFWWWDDWWFAPDDTVFIVTSYTFVDGAGNDIARLWVNPSVATFGASNAPPPNLTATSSNDVNQISSLVLMQRPQPILPAVTFVDEVRVGTTWASVTPPATADLAVSIGSLPAQIQEGDVLPVSITASNLGPNTATSVQVTFSLPTGVVLQSVTNDHGSCTVEGSNVTCSANALAPEQSLNVLASLQCSNSIFDEIEDFELNLRVQAVAAESDPNPPNNAADAVVRVVPDLDFGDARPPYPVTRAENGARHRNGSVYRMGANFDREPDGVHSPNADADDLAGAPSDEDGVVLPGGPFVAGHTHAITVTVPVAGYLDAFFDFNNDGDWNDPGERVTPAGGSPIGPGAVPVPVGVPISAVTGSPHARFRFSDVGGLGPTGFHPVGEVVDRPVEIRRMDFGNAPDPTYPTLLANNGARHVVSPGFQLGTLLDYEGDGPDAAPLADEDGLLFVSSLFPGVMAEVRVTTSGPGELDAFIDFNHNGTWEDPSERIGGGSVAALGGVTSIWFAVPSTAVTGATWMRIRFSSGGGLGPTGPAGDGEVEDYPLQIQAPPDLGLVVSASPNPVTDTSNLTYSITVTNKGAGAASGVILRNSLPIGMSFVSATASQGSCSNGQAGVQCSLGTLPPGGSVTVIVVGVWTFDVLVVALNLPEMQEAIEVTNSVMAAAAEMDAAPTDNVATVAVSLLPQRDFGDAPVPAYPTLLPNAARHRIGALRFGTLIDAEPNGLPVDLDDVTAVNDEISDGFGLPAGGFYAGGWTPITIQVSGPAAYIDLWFDTDGIAGWGAADQVMTAVAHPGGGAAVGYMIALPPGAVVGATWARARVHLNPAGLPTTGYGGRGEVVDFQVNILPAAVDLVAVANPAEIVVTEGDPLTQTITVSNKGPSTATGVIGEIHFPPGATLENLQLSQGTGQMEGTNLVVQLGTLAPNASAFVTFTAGTSNIFDSRGDEFFADFGGWVDASVTDLNLIDNTNHATGRVVAKRDFADAPDASVAASYAYPTRLVDNGARHRIVGPYFGGSAPAADRDRDPDGMPTLNADGDDTLDANDDEEGIQILDPVHPGATGVRVRINAPLGGKVDAWVDFNRNGRWGMGAPEQIFTSLALTPGTLDYTFNVPPGAVLGSTYARFRISDLGGLAFTGYATNGEVQDLTVNIQPSIDLEVVAVGNPTVQINEGEPYSLTLRVANNGSNTATGVQFSIATLPDHVIVQSITSSNGSCQVNGSNVTCQLASLAPGQDSVIGVLVALLTGAAEGLPGDEFESLGDLTFRTSAAEPDSDSSNNQLALAAVVLFARDWGDAPSGFPVTNAEIGARHRRKAGFFLGAGWDREANGTHSANADYDDLNGVVPDDEDGVTFTASVAPGAPAFVTVVASAAGYLDAWADFNGDGDWADADEQIFTSQALAAGANTLTFDVPKTAVAGLIFSRWRFSETGGFSYDGPGGKGEVEDHPMTIAARLDFGDAPAIIPGAPAIITAYEVTLARDGGRHEPTLLRLGNNWDTEIDGQPSLAADLDDATGAPDDEDGWTPVPFIVGTVQNITVYVSGAGGLLDLWVDWDRNYNWDAPEHVVAGFAVAPGANVVPVPVPAGIPTGQTYARFRLSTAGTPLPSGYAPDGEVEDYLVDVSTGGGGPNPVYFAGLEHTASGHATVAVSSNALLISNLGSSGQDSVSIALGEAEAWGALLAGETTIGSNSAFSSLSLGAYGVVDGSNAFLGWASFVNSNGVVNGFIWDPPTPWDVRINAYDGSNLVGSFLVPEDGFLGTLSGDLRLKALSVVAEPGRDAFYDWEWFGDWVYTPPGQPTTTLTANRLRLVVVGSSNHISSVSRVEVRGSASQPGQGTIELTSEAVRQLGVWHRGVGDALLDTTDTDSPPTLRVGHIGTSGQDGIETILAGGSDLWDLGDFVTLPSRIVQAWPDDWEMPWLTSSNSRVTWTAMGRLTGSSSAFENLGDLTAFRQEQGTMLSARFDALGVTQAQVEVFNGPALVGSVTLPVGDLGSLAGTYDVRRVTAQLTDNTLVWITTGAEPWNFQPANGSPALVGDRIRIAALGPQITPLGLRSLLTRGANVESFALRGFNTAAPRRPSLSPPRLLTGDRVELSFSTEPDVSYEVERSPSVNGPWTPIGRVMGTDGTDPSSFFDVFVGDEAFYRVRVR